MKYKGYLFFLLFFVVLTLFFQITNSYRFFYQESDQLFVFAWTHYLKVHLAQPGGFLEVINAFFTQFFIIPWVGPIFTAALLTGIYMLVYRILRRIAPGVHLYLIAFVPVLFLIFLHFEYYYLAKGTLAYLFVLLAMLFYLRVSSFSKRLTVSILLIPAFYWLFGSAAMLLAVCLILWEVIYYKPRNYILILVIAVETICVCMAGVLWKGDYKYTFLPDFYYHIVGPATPVILYLSWISLPLAFLAAWLFRNFKKPSFKIETISLAFQVACIFLLTWQGYLRLTNRDEIYLTQLYYLSGNERWDEIIELSEGKQNNFVFLNYLNLALANKDLLAEKAFHYEQSGQQGILVDWRAMGAISTTLSEIYFSMGNISMAQSVSFESNLNSTYNYSPRMLQRLAQTNLMYEAWPIAEKYLNILSRTLFYRNWAEKHRRFLYNPEAVANDPLLGEKKSYILPVAENYLTGPWNFKNDLWAITRHNPQNQIAIDYLGIACLLEKNLDDFMQFLHYFYPPESGKTLPKSYQEALLIRNINNPDILREFKIPQEQINRYNEYRKILTANRNNPKILKSLALSHGDSYWFYFTKKL